MKFKMRMTPSTYDTRKMMMSQMMKKNDGIHDASISGRPLYKGNNVLSHGMNKMII